MNDVVVSQHDRWVVECLALADALAAAVREYVLYHDDTTYHAMTTAARAYRAARGGT
jgi:hypothetical protein